ncbi:MAG: translation initiation factor eIF-2B, partial [Ktedonobacterales bacterium]
PGHGAGAGGGFRRRVPDDGAALMGGNAAGALPPELADAVRLVREDREHGASWLARMTARALASASQPGDVAEAAERLARLHTAAAAFVAARPSMAAVANTAARAWAAARIPDAPDDSDAAPEVRLRAVYDGATALLSRWDDSTRAMVEAAHPLLSGTIFTHSRSGTVEAVLRSLADSGANGERCALVTESRPGGEGVALARSLASGGWRVTLIADAASGSFLPQAGVVVLGADSVRDDGSVVNKIGSYLVALAARAAGVPVYVLCETLKIAAPGFPLVFEEMDAGELLPEAVAGVTPRNVYFDRTPAELISGVISERGLLSREEIRRRAEEAGAALDLLSNGE